MKAMVRLLAVVAGLLVSHGLMAQAPAGAPAGSTGICKDGTYTSATNKKGACQGHKGVQTWYEAASTSAPAKAAAMPAPTSAPAKTAAMPAPTPAAAPAAKPAPAMTKPAPAAMMPQAAGGGPGMVWVNTETKVYHCSGTRYYGKTKAGKYMSEADAKAMGARADHGTACSK
jgi:hypothetical protein